MAAGRGREMVLKLGNGASPAVFTAIAGLLTRGVTVNGELVDVTTGDSTKGTAYGLYREALENTGMVSVAISVTGFFQDDAAMKTIRELAMSNSFEEFQMVFANGDIMQGIFGVTSFERTGEHNNAEQFNISFESAGWVTWMT